MHMRTILYFIFFYLFYRILRRLIVGPRPRRSFYVNFERGGTWGNASASGSSPFGDRNYSERTAEGEPMVGGRPKQQTRMNERKRVEDVQDAEFKEIE